METRTQPTVVNAPFFIASGSAQSQEFLEESLLSSFKAAYGGVQRAGADHQVSHAEPAEERLNVVSRRRPGQEPVERIPLEHEIRFPLPVQQIA